MKTPHVSILSLAFGLSATALVACGGGGGGGTGSGGSSGTGTGGTGSGGTSGTVDCSMNVATNEDTISDFEDGTGGVLVSQGRNGGWYAYNDMSATCMETPAGMGSANAEMIPGGRCGSMFAIHVFGSGCTLWGAGVGTDFAAPPPPDGGAVDAGATAVRKTEYDVSMFTGIQFWARGEMGKTPSVRVKLPMTSETKVADGGDCMATEVGMDKCSDDYGSKIVLSPTWKLYKLPFSAMAQEKWGKAFDWDPKKVTSVQMQVAMSTMFDFWVDDVAFYK